MKKLVLNLPDSTGLQEATVQLAVNGGIVESLAICYNCEAVSVRGFPFDELVTKLHQVLCEGAGRLAIIKAAVGSLELGQLKALNRILVTLLAKGEGTTINYPLRFMLEAFRQKLVEPITALFEFEKQNQPTCQQSTTLRKPTRRKDRPCALPIPAGSSTPP